MELMEELGCLPFVACGQCRSRLGQFGATLVLRILLITPQLVVDQRVHWPVPGIMAMLIGPPAGFPELGLDLVEPLQDALVHLRTTSCSRLSRRSIRSTICSVSRAFR